MADKAKTEVAKATRSPLDIMCQRFNIEPLKLIQVLRGTVIKPTRGRDGKEGRAATNEELAAFVMVANEYQLNPLTKEIHAFVSEKSGGVVPIVGIDGWTRIVNRQPGFNGMEFEEVPFGDGTTPESITCIMHVKGRDHPVKITERYKECHRDTAPWKNMPWRMLRHKALMQCARYAFSLAGIYDEDEANDIINRGLIERAPVAMPRAIGDLEWPEPPKEAVPVETQSSEPETKPANGEMKPSEGEVPNTSDEPIAVDMQKEILALFKKSKWEPQVIQSFLGKWQVAEVQYLSPAQGKEVIASLLLAVGGKK